MGKNQQIKPSAGLTDQLHRDIMLSAEIRQIETKLFDFFFDSPTETLCNSLQQITVTIPVYPRSNYRHLLCL